MKKSLLEIAWNYSQTLDDDETLCVTETEWNQILKDTNNPAVIRRFGDWSWLKKYPLKLGGYICTLNVTIYGVEDTKKPPLGG